MRWKWIETAADLQKSSKISSKALNVTPFPHGWHFSAGLRDLHCTGPRPKDRRSQSRISTLRTPFDCGDCIAVLLETIGNEPFIKLQAPTEANHADAVSSEASSGSSDFSSPSPSPPSSKDHMRASATPTFAASSDATTTTSMIERHPKATGLHRKDHSAIAFVTRLPQPAHTKCIQNAKLQDLKDGTRLTT